MQVENYMARDLQDEPKEIGVCMGCGEYIYSQDEVYDCEEGLIHQDSNCCQEYISNKSICRTAGE